MKVCVIVDNEFTIDIRVKNEVRFLQSIGYEMHILCPSFNNQPLFEKIDGISIHRFSLKKSTKNKLFGLMNLLPLYEFLWTKKVHRIVKKIKPQLIHAHDLYMAKIANKGGNAQIPIILDLHENFPEAILSYKWSSKFPYRILSRPNAWRKKELEYLNYADNIVVLSSFFKTSLIGRYPNINANNIFVYPNVPDVQQLLNFPINPNILNKQGKFILFYFGGISERRGIYTCFEAIKILSNEIPSIHLLLIGPVDGHEQVFFNQYMSDPIIKERVTHYQWKELSEFPSYTTISDVCISPIYRNEQHESGVANKVFQYMLFEKPLLVSDCAPQVEIVKENSCGIVFKSNDVADLANKIKILYNDPDGRMEMGKNGKKAVLEKFNLEICGKELEKAYLNIQRN